MKGKMKKLKILIMGAMLAMAAFSVIAQCWVSSFHNCPTPIPWPSQDPQEPGTMDCDALVNNYKLPKPAGVGESGLDNTIENTNQPVCLYLCYDSAGTKFSLYPNVIPSGKSCKGVVCPNGAAAVKGAAAGGTGSCGGGGGSY